MIVTYDVYKRDNNPKSRTYGRKNILIQDYEKLSITLNWSKLSKFEMEGKSTTACPFSLGDRVVIFRTSSDVDMSKPSAEATKLVFAGIVDDIKIECKDVVSEIMEWSVSGKEDSVLLDWRVILTDNGVGDGTVQDYSDMTFEDKTYDKCADKTAAERIIHYLRNCFDVEKTMKSRAIVGAEFPLIANIPSAKRGAIDTSSYRLKKLSEVLKEISDEVKDEETGEQNNLFVKYQWNPATGTKTFDIPLQTDKTRKIIIAPQFGNVARWSVSKTYPKFNAVWVCSGDYEEKENEGEENEETWTTRVWVYAEDAESIEKYGRIENVIVKSDIKITEDDENTEEDETLTADEVADMLSTEAIKALRENSAKEKYTIELAEIEGMHFMTDWECGDLVRCIIDYDEETGKPKKFDATIETVNITYQNLEENVKPTIGDVEEGIFGDFFSMIAGLDIRLQSEEGK